MIQNPAQKVPTAPAIEPVAAAARTVPSANAIYEGFRAQRRESTNQLQELEGTRRDITSQLEDVAAGSPERQGLESRLSDVDSRINSVDQMLAANAAQVSQAAAIPGAVVEPPRVVDNGVPEEVYALSGLFMLIVLLPISVALARRIWRRNAATVTAFRREMGERLLRMEQALEATAIEVERIGEGQRFLTRLFTEAEATRSIGAGAAQPIERKPLSTPRSIP